MHSELRKSTDWRCSSGEPETIHEPRLGGLAINLLVIASDYTGPRDDYKYAVSAG